MLAFTTRAAARDVEKVLRSAVANAEANHGLIGDDLYVSEAFVDEGPTLKRWRARARGRAGRIHKRTCHITVKVALVPPDPNRPAKRPAEPQAAEKPARKPRQAKPKTDAPIAEAAVVEETPKPKRVRTPRRKKTEEAGE